MIFMSHLQSNAPIGAAAMVRFPSNLVQAPGVPPHEDHGFRMTAVGWVRERRRGGRHLSLIELRDGGHASAFALRATADKSLFVPYGVAREGTKPSRIHMHEIPQQRINLVVPALAGKHA